MALSFSQAAFVESLFSCSSFLWRTYFGLTVVDLLWLPVLANWLVILKRSYRYRFLENCFSFGKWTSEVMMS